MAQTRFVLAALVVTCASTLAYAYEIGDEGPAYYHQSPAGYGSVAVSDLLDPAEPAKSGAEQTPEAGAAAAGAEIEKLAKGLETVGSHLTVLTATTDVKLILGGQIVADFLYNSARPVAPGTPFFLTTGSLGGLAQDTFDAHARQTALYGLVQGPKVCLCDEEWESGGFILVNLYNDALVVDRYGILPIQAFGQLKNDSWRFAAGLQLDIFNPLNPTVLPFSLMLTSGNTGAFRGQARVERYYYPDECSQITLTGGISDPLPTILTSDFDLSEDNGWPNLEGRIAFGFGALEGEGLAAKRPVEVGISAVVGQMRTTTPPANRVVADVWGLGADARYAFNRCCGIQGELFIGQGLGTYGGSIFETVNTNTFEAVRSCGGWIEVYYYLVPDCLHTHWGFGIDDPKDVDVTAAQALRNQGVFANLIWDVNKFFRLGTEVTYRQTGYSVVPDNDGVGVQAQAMWKF